MASEKVEQSDYKHGTPPEGWECLATMDDITIEDGNYVEYQSFPSLKWQPAKFEESTVEHLLNNQFHTFIEKVKTTDCQAELRRLLAQGPPIYIEDKHAMPLADPDTDTHICKLWFQRDNVETTAKLDGAVEGQERDKLWEELKSFIVVEGKEKEDEDSDDGNRD